MALTPASLSAAAILPSRSLAVPFDVHRRCAVGAQDDVLRAHPGGGGVGAHPDARHIRNLLTGGHAGGSGAAAHRPKAASDVGHEYVHHVDAPGSVADELTGGSGGSEGPHTGVGGHQYARVPVLSILFYTSLMTMASGFGAVPFFVFGRLKPYWAGLANAVAVGVMMAASFDLLHEGAPHSAALTILGMIIGALFIKASQDYLSQFEDASFEDLQGADARKAMLIIAVMAAHAFGEGAGVGVSYSGQRGWAQVGAGKVFVKGQDGMVRLVREALLGKKVS